MKVIVLNMQLSGRESRDSYTDLTDPVAPTIGALVAGDLPLTMVMYDASDVIITTNYSDLAKLKFNSATPYQFSGVSTDVSSIQVQLRRTSVTEALPFGGATNQFLQDNGGGNWELPNSALLFDAVEWDTPQHLTSSWSDLQVRFKMTSGEGVTWTDWIDCTITQA